MKYTITGSLTIDVTATIEADDVEDAKSQFDLADCTVESSDENITFNSCCQSDSDIDDATCVGEDVWESMDKSERMEMLKGNGASDDAAYEKAGGSFDDLPEEWQEYFG